MKQRFWIILIMILCIGFICIGAYNLCSHQNSLSEAPSPSPYEENKDNNPLASGYHYDNLDKVKMPMAIESEEVEYEGFRLSFNRHNRTPNWVAWELLGSETEGATKRHNKFWQDSGVEGCPTTTDYRNSGYDRGHMCPAADQKWSAKAMDDCFVMTNICPQDHSLNSGAWNTLENKERTWAMRDSVLMIIAGPVYGKDDNTRIGGGVLVPGAFFKVILAPYVDKPRAIAFVYPNMTAPGNMQNYVMTVDDLEQLTGYDFFSALPDDIENIVESTASFREWNNR